MNLFSDQHKRKFNQKRLKLCNYLRRNTDIQCLFVTIICVLVIIYICSNCNELTQQPKNDIESVVLKHCNPENEFARFQEAGGAKQTGCPNNNEWMKAFADLDPSPNKNIVIIGCNKGVDAINLFSQYDNQQSPLDSGIWREYLRNLEIDNKGNRKYGACNQLSVNAPHFDRRVHDNKFEMISPTVYCVEAMLSNFELLKESESVTNIDLDYFKIMHYAVGNESRHSFVDFPNAGTGTEHFGIGYHGKYNTDSVETVRVKMMSLDSLCVELNQIDILSVDTEGNDPDVLFGGRQTLMKTRYLEFECHRDFKETAWGNHTLYSVIAYLDELKFDCFWSNNHGKLFQITNCWNGNYEKEAFVWSNIVCVKRNDIWHSIMKSIYEKQKE